MVAQAEQYVTVPRAAKLLGIGSKAMSKLLDEGRVEFITPRHHRRVLLASVLRHRDAVTANRNVRVATVDDDPLSD